MDKTNGEIYQEMKPEIERIKAMTDEEIQALLFAIGAAVNERPDSEKMHGLPCVIAITLAAQEMGIFDVLHQSVHMLARMTGIAQAIDEAMEEAGEKPAGQQRPPAGPASEWTNLNLPPKNGKTYLQ